MKEILNIGVCGGTSVGPGELFRGAACGHIKQISNDGWETGSGGTFLGLDSTTLNKSVLTMGEPGPDPGELFFRDHRSNTNEGKNPYSRSKTLLARDCFEVQDLVGACY